jgi:hypothetical protein
MWMALVAGCDSPMRLGDAGGGDGATADAEVDAAPAEPRLDDEPRRGVIQILEVDGASGAYGIAQAAYLEAPTRMRFVHYAQIVVVHAQTETMREGACRLLENEPQFCTDCDGICVGPEICEPLPVYASAGTLDVTGLNVALSLAPGQYWYSSQGAVPDDAFESDAIIEVAASGATIPAHTVAAEAVSTLVADLGDEPVTLTDGADLTIRWTPEPGDARVRLLLNANNEGHGNPFAAIIECEGPDNGALTVPRALIEAFPPVQPVLPGCEGSDCPASQLTRYRRSEVAVAGSRVVLTVGSERQFLLAHE